MKLIHIVLFVFFSLLFFTNAYAQKGKLLKANTLYELGAYPEAAELYKDILDRDKNSAEAKIKIADCYRLMRRPVIAEYWYEQVVDLLESKSIHRYHYGMALKANGNYEKAERMFKEYAQLVPADKRGGYQIQACQQAPYFLTNPKVYDVVNVSINTKLADFGAAFYKNGIVYSSESTGGKNYDRRDAPFLDLFYAEQIAQDGVNFATPKPFGGQANTPFHEAAVTFSEDEKIMYFTANNIVGEKKAGNRKIPIINLQIFEVERKDNAIEWENMTPFPYNNVNYSVGHPTLSKDGKTMYFASDMEGGKGGTDIYVTYNKEGYWTTPINLGDEINTPGDEMFPYISDMNTLYFSSDALPGLGGLDVFVTQEISPNNWATPENLRSPINSNGDDFSFIMNEEKGVGYLSSNRTGGRGDDDIYSVRKIGMDVMTEISGQVLDKTTNEAVSDANIKILNSKTNQQQITKKDGSYTFTVPAGEDYTIYVTKEFYFTEVQNVATRDGKTKKTIDIYIASIPNVNTETGDLNEPIKIVSGSESAYPDLPLPTINHIYYDLNKSDIRPDAMVELDKIVAFMVSNPQVKIELGSHTDARGSDSYNQKLSEQRAKSAMDYIIARGISASNITAVGYGETDLVNRCLNDVECSEAEHEQNRRTEFLIKGFIVTEE